jgi:hypothetical protein
MRKGFLEIYEKQKLNVSGSSKSLENKHFMVSHASWSFQSIYVAIYVAINVAIYVAVRNLEQSMKTIGISYARRSRFVVRVPLCYGWGISVIIVQ